MNKIILGIGTAVGLTVAVAAIAAPAGRLSDNVEKASSSLAVKFVNTANQAEDAAWVALGSDAAAVAAAAGNTPAVAGEAPVAQDKSVAAHATDAAVSEDVVALIVVAIENDVKAQVAAGVPTLSISSALTRASNTPNLSKNVAAAFGRVQTDLADLFDEYAPGAVDGHGNNVNLLTSSDRYGGPSRQVAADDTSSGGGSSSSDDGASDGGSSSSGGDDSSSDDATDGGSGYRST